jgi:hypothetical protein
MLRRDEKMEEGGRASCHGRKEKEVQAEWTEIPQK